jgi:hypothetical protein
MDSLPYSTCFAIATTGFLLLAPGFAASSGQEIQVSFALVLRDGEPHAATVTCHVGVECPLTSGDANVRLALTPTGRGMAGVLSVECTQSCSFVTGRSSMAIDGKNRQPIDIYRGEDRQIETLLVLRPRKVMGNLQLILSKM